jgi:hypothetical protein
MQLWSAFCQYEQSDWETFNDFLWHPPARAHFEVDWYLHAFHTEGKRIDLIRNIRLNVPHPASQFRYLTMLSQLFI